MLIHDNFIFIHVPKTGGSFLGSALKREMPAGSLRRGAPEKKHPGWNDIPDEALGRPVLIYVRNPWDWYVSWYHAVASKHKQRHPDADVVAGVTDLDTLIRQACSGSLPGSQPPPSPGHQDLYTQNILRACGDRLEADELFVGRFESLVDDLGRFLSAAGAPLGDAAIGRIRSAEPVNASEHRPYREYYDGELQELVASSCRVTIERFGYRF